MMIKRIDDPIITACVVGALEIAVREMTTVMRKTGASTIIKICQDYSNCLFAGDGKLVAQGEDLPTHMGSMITAMRGIINYFGDDIHPGDLIFHNDVETGGGHSPDMTVYKPVFYEDELVFWTANKAHYIDCGGGRLGGYDPYAEDIYEEGIRIPPTKIYENGKERRDVINLIMANVRYPKLERIDLQAQIAAAKIGERRLIELMDKYTKQAVKISCDELLKSQERRLRDWIKTLPDGVYESNGWIEYPQKQEALPTHCKVVINGDEINVSLFSPPQAPAYINSYKGGTAAGVYQAVLKYFNPPLPINEGLLEPIKIDFGPEGSIFNAKLPAACLATTAITHCAIVDVVNCAMSKAMPFERLCAGWGHTYVTASYGVDPKTNEGYGRLNFGSAAGGGGAVAGRDGFPGIGGETGAGGPPRDSAELHEYEEPVFIRALEMRTDSASPGKWRGGCGVTYEFEAIDHTHLVTGCGGGEMILPLSVGGAKSRLETESKLNRRYVYGRDGRCRRFPTGIIQKVEIGETVSCRPSGGGGVGDPFERDPLLVLEDVINEVISLEGAEIDYGVVIDPKKMKVDLEETKKTRAKQS